MTSISIPRMTSRLPSHQNFTVLGRRTSTVKWTSTPWHQNNNVGSSRPVGSSDLDHLLFLLMILILHLVPWTARFVAKGYILSLERQDSLPRDTVSTSATPSRRHLQQHLRVHHWEHCYFMQYYISTKWHHATSHQLSWNADRGGHLSSNLLQRSTNIDLESSGGSYGLRTSPKMWQEHLNATLRDTQLHQLMSDRCVWVKKNIIVLAYVDDLLIAGTSRDTPLFLEQLRQSSASNTLQFLHLNNLFTSRESASAVIHTATSQSVWKGLTTTAHWRTWTSTTTAILHQHDLCGDLQHNKIHSWILIDITSSAKLLVCSSGHPRYVQTFSLQRRTTLDICHLRQSGIGHIWSIPSGSDRYIKGTMHKSSSSHLDHLKVTHYHFGSWYLFTSTPIATVIGPLTAIAGSLPLAQMPQHFKYIWHSTAEHRAQPLYHQQKPNSTPSVSASVTAYTSTNYLKNFNIIFKSLLSTSATSTLSTTSRPWQHLNHWHQQNHRFTSSQTVCLHQQAWPQQRSKHIALRYLFVQDIQVTGLVNIQRVTSHNNLADIYTKCVTSPVLERHLRHNGIIELHIETGEINHFHVLELAEQYFNDSNVEYNKEQLQRIQDSSEHTKNMMKQHNLSKQKKKENKKFYLENKRREAAQWADIEHKQSQLLLQQQDLSHRAQQPQVILKTSKDKREEHLDHMKEEYKKDLDDDYILFINMIDINNNEQRPRPRPEQQQETTLPLENGRTTGDIMADILLRKQQRPRQLLHRASSSHLGGD